MSSLTKVFVVLLVVLSLLLTAASVTFVYSVDNYQTVNTTLRAQVDQLNAVAESAKTAAAADVQAAQSRVSNATLRITQLEASLKSEQLQAAQAAQQVSSAGANAKQLETQLAYEKARTNSLVESNDRLYQQIMEFRTLADTRTKENAELSLAVTDLNQKLQVTERERRFAVEQLTEAKGQVEKQTAVIRQYNIPDNAVARVAAPDIKGVVRGRSDIAGVPYATISVGSAADVAKGMQFSIIDRDSGAYLGTLTIEAVEPNEALGRLKGDRIKDVKVGNEVRTQL